MLAVVLGTSWCITLLAFVYIAINADKQAKENEEFLKARIEAKVCQEKAEALVKQIVACENQLKNSIVQLEQALIETRLAKDFAFEQSKIAIKRK
jgi:hypothetical protein